jgi:A/G-specific adenine glycosylase
MRACCRSGERRTLAAAGESVVLEAAVARAIRRELLAWFKHNRRNFPWRRRKTTLYQSVVAEILLQRTQAETVAKFFDTFITRFRGWRDLADAGVNEIGRMLRPIGLWRRRASSLSLLAKEMAARNGRFPQAREEIEGLPGVGQYIGNSILLFAQGKAEPLLDVNMARFLERLIGPRKLVDIRFDPHLQVTSRRIVRGKSAVQLNWAILDLSAAVCTLRDPRCDQCPLRPFCRFATQRAL